MATKRQKRRRRQRQSRDGGAPAGGSSAQPAGNPAAPSATALDDAQPARAARRRAGDPERPTAPWGSVPLSEIVIFIALVMLIAGFVVTHPRRCYPLAAGRVLGSLAGLELGIREHFSGYRSHSLLLAGGIAVPILAGLVIWDAIPPVASLGIAAVVFAVSAWLFAQAFRRR